MKHKIKILFRSSLAEEYEKLSIVKYFNIIESRSLAQKGDLIIGRYSTLPYYDELEKDIKIIGAELINSFRQHRYIADMSSWYLDFEDITPKTWFRVEEVPENQAGSFILKGETNSKKHLWKTHMFAKNKEEITSLYLRLLDDSLVSTQNIYVRQFEPMIKYGDGLNGLPISKEFRFFIFDKQVVASGFYWSDQIDLFDGQLPNPTEVPKTFLDDVINRVGNNSRFYVVDIGQKINGDWMVVELNCGTMSGLSCVNPDELYGNLKNILVK